MYVPDGFGSWESYRSFVETSQRELFDPLYDAFEQSALDLSDGPSGWLFGEDAQLDVDWEEPFKDKWLGRDLHYADSVEYLLRHGDSASPADGIEEHGGLSDRQEAMESEGLEYSHVDDERYFHYEAQAPMGALATENYLDAVTCFLAGLAQTDADQRAAVYDVATAQDEHENLTAHFIVEWLFEPFDRAAVVDGSALATAFEELDQRYEQLVPITVWGTEPGPSLAIDDEALAEGVGHPRTWDVRPAPVLSGLDGAITGPDSARATVTVDREHTIETSANHLVSGFHRGTVEECDDSFPADPGEEVLVAAANVVDMAAETRPHGPEGRTATQIDLLATARSDPASLDDGDVEDLVTWATTGEPDARVQAVDALASVAVETEHEGLVDTLAGGLDDAVVDVRQEAAAALRRVGDTDPGSLADATASLVDSLDDADETVREDAAAALETIADGAPSMLTDHAGTLREQLAERAGLFPDGSGEVRVALMRALDQLRAVGVPVATADPETVTLVAAVGGADERTPATRTLVAALAEDDDGRLFDAVVAAAESELCSNVDHSNHAYQYRAANGLERLAALDTDIVVATGVRETLLELVRGEHHPGLRPNGIEPAVRLLGALYETHPDFVLADDVLDALVSGRDDVDGVEQIHATVLGRLGYHRPDAVADALEPLLATARDDVDSSCGRRDSAAWALCLVGAADPERLGPEVADAMVDLYESHDHSHVKSKAVQAATVAGEPVLTDDAWDRITNGRTETLPERRLAAVAVMERVAEADRSFFTDQGGFGWLRAVVTDDRDSRVVAEALRVLTDMWLADPEFVEQRCLPLDHDTVREADDGVTVEGVGGRTEVEFADTPVPDRTGIDVLGHLVDALEMDTRPTQLRVADALEGLAAGGSADPAVDHADLEPLLSPLLESADTDDGTAPQWLERVLTLLERAAAERPDRAESVVTDLAAIDPAFARRVEDAL